MLKQILNSMKNILKRIAVVVVLFATVANMWVANTNKEVNLNTSLESLEADAFWPVVVEIIIGVGTGIASAYAYDYFTTPSVTDKKWVKIGPGHPVATNQYCGTEYVEWSVPHRCDPYPGGTDDCTLNEKKDFRIPRTSSYY